MTGPKIGSDPVPDTLRLGDNEPRMIEAGTLLRGEREVVIVHKGERYRLRLTQNDKLILTK